MHGNRRDVAEFISGYESLQHGILVMSLWLAWRYAGEIWKTIL